jgi:hypothetical protein
VATGRLIVFVLRDKGKLNVKGFSYNPLIALSARALVKYRFPLSVTCAVV